MKNKVATLEEYLRLPYTVILRQDEEGDFIASIKELDGCVADGSSEEEALSALRSMKKLWLEMALKKGAVIPEPDKEDDLPSGKWLQRVPRSLHKKLADLAKNEGVSLNQLVTSFLAEAVGMKSAHRRAEASALGDISAATGTDGIKTKVLNFANRASTIHLRDDAVPRATTEAEEIAQTTFASTLRAVYRSPNIQLHRSHLRNRT